MTVWSHLPTIFNQRRVLRIAGIITLCVALITTLFFGYVSHATSGINKTLGFQARLQRPSGGIIPDGHYNIQFKIYQDGAGTATGNPGGTLKWTESYINNGGTSGVEVKNGYLSVDLGSVTPFGTSVDWNQDTLWLSMNIAGSATDCTAFGSGSCVADGEMLPMQRLTATPYALNAGQVGGKNVDQLVQLGQGSQADSSSNSSIFINKLGVGSFLQLQNTGTNVFSVAGSGDVIFGSNTNHSISIEASASDLAGQDLRLAAGDGGTGSGANGGDLVLLGGDAGGTNGNGGNITVDSGAGSGSGSGGTVAIGSANAGSIIIGSTSGSTTQTISIGTNNTSGSSSDVVVGAGGSASGGSTNIQAKEEVTISTNGTTRATFSDVDAAAYFGNGITSGMPTDFKIQATGSSATAVTGGTLTLQGGDASTGDANGGDIILSGGTGAGTGTSGLVVLTTPTFSAKTNDQNCYTSGAPVASSCTIAGSSIDGSSAIVLGFSATGQTATLPDPTNTTVGRIVYLLAADNSEQFTLSANGDTMTAIMRPGDAATLMWNGSKWAVAGQTSSSALRDAYSNDTNSINVQVGEPDDSKTSLLTLDKASSAPTVTDSNLLGSMYYDTTLGKVQCYELEGWGACGASPDTFITISPEYTNAVMNGTDIGTITSDICSDTLNLNDGSSSQPTICGTNETYNFYKWTSAESTSQTRSIYVTYQLPNNFKEFVAGSTSLMGRTDSSDASVNYQVYRDHPGSSLQSCGSAVSVSTGSQSAWQEGTASGSSDPSACSFQAGDSIFIRINMTSKSDAKAYVSNINFTFSNE